MAPEPLAEVKETKHFIAGDASDATGEEHISAPPIASKTC